jgi:hypothetical protein
VEVKRGGIFWSHDRVRVLENIQLEWGKSTSFALQFLFDHIFGIRVGLNFFSLSMDSIFL